MICQTSKLLRNSVFSAGIVLAFGMAATGANADGIKGVTWIANYTAESAEVVHGGLADRGAYAGQIFLGAVTDLDQTIGWKGAKFTAFLINRHGENLSNKGVGNSISVQEIYGDQGTHIADLSIEQKLLNDKLTLVAGRTVANVAFFGSSLCQYFQTNGACFNSPLVFRDSSFVPWPQTSWSFRAHADLTDKVYFDAGAYEVNPYHGNEKYHGLKWGTEGDTGVNIPFVLGYKTTFKNDSMPRKFEIGGYYDTASYTDPLNDESGQPAILTGNDNAERNGRAGYYFRFRQMVWRHDKTSHRGLTLFGSLMGRVAGRVMENDYQEIGFVLNGTFESRPKDSLAFVFTRQHFSNIEMKYLTLARESAGGVGSPHSDEMMMELSYGFDLVKDIRFQPNIQYVIHPDQANDPTRVKNLPNALVLGFRFDVNFDDAFGMNR